MKDPRIRHQVSIKLDPVRDQDIIEYLSTVTNVQGYFKSLIRAQISYMEYRKEMEANSWQRASSRG